MTNLLWRIVGTSAAPDVAGWQQGLTLHLLFQSVTIILVRRDDETRRYLALDGCPHCRPDGCDHGCPRGLFAQLVRTALPGAVLTAATRILPDPSEGRRLAARPTHAAQPLDADFLATWGTGRLMMTWSRLRARPQPLTVGALLAVGADGPSPARALREAGWHRSPLATAINRATFLAPVPPPVRMGGRAGEALLHAIRDPFRLMDAQPTLVQED